jgi:hypothetical protein
LAFRLTVLFVLADLTGSAGWDDSSSLIAARRGVFVSGGCANAAGHADRERPKSHG